MDSGIQTEIIWPDGPSPEFKNQFTEQLIEDCLFSLRKIYLEVLGIVGGNDCNIKSNERCQVMSMKKNRSIVWNSESFAELDQKLVPSTKIKYFSDEEVQIIKRPTHLKTQFL